MIERPGLWGTLYGALTFISLFWGLYAGTLVDRFDRKHLFLFETSISGFLVLCVSALGFYLGAMPMFGAALVFAITFFNYNLHYPALYAFAQEISEPKDYQRITSYLEIQGQSTNALGGGLAALLISGLEAGPVSILGFDFNIPFSISPWGLETVFLADGLTYLLSFVILWGIVYTPVAIRNRKEEAKSGMLKQIEVGIDFLKKNPLIFLYGNAAYFVFVTTMVINMVMMPNFVSNHLNADASVFAIGDAAFACGAILSGFMISRLFGQGRLVLGSIVTTLITTIAFLILSYNRLIGVFYLLMLFLGIANSGTRILRVSYIFQHIPNQVIGRTQSVFKVINVFFRMFFIFLFSTAFFVQEIGIAFMIFSVCCFLAALLMMVYYRRLVEL